MIWSVEYTDEFGAWWDSLSAAEQESVAASVGLLEQLGPDLPFPHSSGIAGSRHKRLRELRVQHRGRPFRILYAFDPGRTAVLLVGGDKSGQDRWYDEFVPLADRLYDEHLAERKKKGFSEWPSDSRIFAERCLRNGKNAHTRGPAPCLPRSRFPNYVAVLA